MGLYSDLNLDNGVYIPQYAGAPLEEIKQTGDVLSERHYQNLAQANQLGILQHQVRANLLPGARSYADQHIAAVDEAIQDMAKNGGENSTARVNALVSTFSGDEKLIRAQQISQARQKDTAAGEEIRQKTGKAALYKQKYHDYVNAGVNSDLYNMPYEASATTELNPLDDIQQVLKEMHPDSWQSPDLTPVANAKLSDLARQMRAGDIDVPTFLRQAESAGLSQAKIDQLQKNFVDAYKLTPSYKQQKDYKGTSDEELADQIINYAPLKRFKQTGNNMIHNTDAQLRGAGSGKDNIPGYTTYAPGDVVKTAIPYDKDGFPTALPTTPMIQGATPGHTIVMAPIGSGQEVKQRTEMHPQAVRDLATSKEVFGASGTLGQYTDLIRTRVENPVTYTPSPDDLTKLDNALKHQYGLREYMDQATGRVIVPYGKDGKMTQEFIDLTGGDPSKFMVESQYDAKNHFTKYPGSNEKFVTPLAVVSEDKDGKQHRFLASQPPGPFTNPAVNSNTNAIYTRVNTRPGQETDLGNGIKAKELHGAQLSQFSPQDLQGATYPILASVPGLNEGKTMLYSSPEHLAQVLAQQKIYLKVN